jgi:hypothetical protein
VCTHMWRGHEGRILSQDVIERRASGRRHYNSVRQFETVLRRGQVAQLMAAGTTSRVALAARLGVHPSTISCDFTALLGARRMPHVRQTVRASVCRLAVAGESYDRR